MKIFILDLWHDLKEKRLWPVAAALLVGLVAVPVILAKPAGTASAPAPVPNASPADSTEALKQLAQVKLGDDEVGDGSTLGVFDPDNPFRPPKGAIKKQDTVDNASSAGPDTGTPTGSDDASGGAGGGTTGDTGTTTGDTGGIGDTGDGTTTTTTVYKYVVDVTFEANGRVRHIKGLEKLDMLPNQDAPLLIFMGVTANGGNAVFMVDSTLSAAGEGKCKPSASRCAFAYIGAGSEYMFRNEDGDTYRVKIDEIRKVKVSPNGSGASAGAAKGAKAHASVGAPRRFIPPSFADEVVVASETLRDSNSDTDSR
jgi:hypothetical protein